MKKIAKKLKKSDNIVIFVHENPDGDAIGSIIALSTALINMGKKVEAFVEKKPENMYFLFENVEWLKNYDEMDLDKKYDVAVSLDCGDIERMGKGAAVFENADFKISLDHHKTNVGFGDLNFVDPDSAATGEIIYDLLKIMKVNVTKEIASALCVAIICDTGMFKHQNTTSKTFYIASKLVSINININQITHKLFNENSFGRTKLLGEILGTLNLYLDRKVGIMFVTQEMMNKYGINENELDGIVDFARNIKGVEIGVFMKQRNEGGYKVSLRANSDADMSKIAEKFNGGGHKGAAACRFEIEDVEEIKKLLLSEIKMA